MILSILTRIFAVGITFSTAALIAHKYDANSMSYYLWVIMAAMLQQTFVTRGQISTIILNTTNLNNVYKYNFLLKNDFLVMLKRSVYSTLVIAVYVFFSNIDEKLTVTLTFLISSVSVLAIGNALLSHFAAFLRIKMKDTLAVIIQSVLPQISIFILTLFAEPQIAIAISGIVFLLICLFYISLIKIKTFYSTVQLENKKTFKSIDLLSSYFDNIDLFLGPVILNAESLSSYLVFRKIVSAFQIIKASISGIYLPKLVSIWKIEGSKYALLYQKKIVKWSAMSSVAIYSLMIISFQMLTNIFGIENNKVNELSFFILALGYSISLAGGISAGYVINFLNEKYYRDFILILSSIYTYALLIHGDTILSLSVVIAIAFGVRTSVPILYISRFGVKA